ncbi:hypothetical protein B5G27_12300 [Lachnoclostridium sp. An76]|nr:hypothetical protein B5G27_12300 [Lachnoclostridium sp. An76]
MTGLMFCSAQKVKGADEEEYITASGREGCPQLRALWILWIRRRKSAGRAERQPRYRVMEGSF